MKKKENRRGRKRILLDCVAALKGCCGNLDLDWTEKGTYLGLALEDDEVNLPGDGGGVAVTGLVGCVQATFVLGGREGWIGRVEAKDVLRLPAGRLEGLLKGKAQEKVEVRAVRGSGGEVDSLEGRVGRSRIRLAGHRGEMLGGAWLTSWWRDTGGTGTGPSPLEGLWLPQQPAVAWTDTHGRRKALETLAERGVLEWEEKVKWPAASLVDALEHVKVVSSDREDMGLLHLAGPEGLGADVHMMATDGHRAHSVGLRRDGKAVPFLPGRATLPKESIEVLRRCLAVKELMETDAEVSVLMPLIPGIDGVARPRRDVQAVQIVARSEGVTLIVRAWTLTKWLGSLTRIDIQEDDAARWTIIDSDRLRIFLERGKRILESPYVSIWLPGTGPVILGCLAWEERPFDGNVEGIDWIGERVGGETWTQGEPDPLVREWEKEAVEAGELVAPGGTGTTLNVKYLLDTLPARNAPNREVTLTVKAEGTPLTRVSWNNGRITTYDLVMPRAYGGAPFYIVGRDIPLGEDGES